MPPEFDFRILEVSPGWRRCLKPRPSPPMGHLRWHSMTVELCRQPGALVGRQRVRSQDYEEFNDAQKTFAKLR